MGNMLLRGVIHRHGRRIKIMKADGTVVKAPAGPRPHGMGSFTRPLTERAELVGGHLYYLIPSPQDELVNCNRGPLARASNSDHSIRIASSRLQPPSSGNISRDPIKQEEADCAVNRGGVTIVSSSHSTDGSTFRVKLRLRKEDLASLLSANNVNIVTENLVLPPSIQGGSRQSPWKPSLDTIAEADDPLGDL